MIAEKSPYHKQALWQGVTQDLDDLILDKCIELSTLVCPPEGEGGVNVGAPDGESVSDTLSAFVPCFKRLAELLNSDDLTRMAKRMVSELDNVAQNQVAVCLRLLNRRPPLTYPVSVPHRSKQK